MRRLLLLLLLAFLPLYFLNPLIPTLAPFVEDGATEVEVRAGAWVPPEPPSGLTAQGQTPITAAGRFSVAIGPTVSLGWDANDPDDSVTRYRVYRARDYGNDFNRIGTTEDTSFTDADVEDGETYVYYVTAVNAVGESDPSDEASASLPPDCAALKDTEDYAAAVADGDCPELEPTLTPEAGVTAAEVLDAESTPAATATLEPTSTPEPTPTGTPFPTRTATPVTTPTAVPTATPEPTDTPEPSSTPEPTASPQPTATQAPGRTQTPIP